MCHVVTVYYVELCEMSQFKTQNSVVILHGLFRFICKKSSDQKYTDQQVKIHLNKWSFSMESLQK